MLEKKDNSVPGTDPLFVNCSRFQWMGKLFLWKEPEKSKLVLEVMIHGTDS